MSRRPRLPTAATATALALACGIVGAGIVHVVSVLAVPANAPRTGYDVAGELGAEGRFVPLAQDDPFLRAAVCRFDLAGPVRVYAEGAVPMWSASVIGSNDVNVYSLNDRVALDGALDLVILGEAEVERWREVLSEDVELVTLDDAAENAGAMVVVRAFLPNETWGPAVTRFLEGATCERVTLD